MELLAVALLGFAAYLIGSIPPSFLLARYRKGVDIREVGSRNAGTLNTFRELGPWWALLVFVIDAAKGAIALLLPSWVGVPSWAVYVTAPLVLAGHNWPVLLRFRGGKGAASLIGIFLAFVPAAAMLGAIPGVLALFLCRNGIVGLVVGFAVANILVLVAWVFQVEWLASGPTWQKFALCLFLTLFVAVLYGISIRNQLMLAIRQRSVKTAFYGS